MLRFFFFLLSAYVAIVQGEAQYQPYFDDSLPTYPINQYQNYYSDVHGRTPNSAEKRWFYGVSTITTTTTTTTTTTCTVSTASACNTSRRKKKALEEEDENIEPSPVNKVEATKLPEVKSKFDAQFAYWRSGSADYPLYELRSTFGRRPSSNNYNNPFVRQEMIVGDPRFAFFYVGFTTTTTSTVTTTSKSTPICSQASNFNAC